MPNDNPIQALADLAKNSSAQLRTLPQKAAFKGYSLREIECIHDDQILIIPVSDEFGDAELHCKAVSLHLILKTCEYYEEAASFASWCSDIEVPNNSFGAALHKNVENLVPKIRDIFGFETRSLDDYHIEFNTSLAKELRASCAQVN